jgi:hypothetical protein
VLKPHELGKLRESFLSTARKKSEESELIASDSRRDESSEER